MTLRIFQIVLGCGAVALLGLSFLVVFRSPDWSFWPLALVAGEFGHGLAVLSLGLALVGWFSRGGQAFAGIVIAVVSVCAALLFCKPVFQAVSLSRDIPDQLTRAFGKTEVGRRPFAFSGLFKPSPRLVAVRTLAYAPELSLDFYPAAHRPSAPCVILVHGGGWDSGDRNELAPFNHWLAGEGYAVAAISYRLAPKFPWPAQRDDITAAIAYVKANASALGVDASRLVLIGRSAGGHLAEAVAYTQHDPAIRGVVALYAPADVHFAWEFARDDDVLKSPQLLRNFLGGTPETHRSAYDSASPIRFVNKNTPPTLLIHGQLDTLVWHRQSERLDAKLTEAGVPHVFMSLPWATHAFEYNLNGPGGQLARYSIGWFLAAVTR